MASFQTDLRAGPLDLDTSKHKIGTNIMLKALILTNHQIRAIQNRKWSMCSCLLSQAAGYKNLFFSAGNSKFESLSVIWSLTEEMMMRFLMRGGEGENWSTTRRPLVLPCDLVCTQRLWSNIDNVLTTCQRQFKWIILVIHIISKRQVL